LKDEMTDSRRDPDVPAVVEAPTDSLPVVPAELPVVARIVVEIRSDGMRTLARGAMEDAASQTRVAIEASGATPLELALALAKSIMAAPWLPRGSSIQSLGRLLKSRR
jgi:hypothetical protein